MKAQLIVVVAAATGAFAQSYVSSSNATMTSGPVYVTTTVDDCPMSSPEQMITVTNGVTVTYCPMCTGGMDTTHTTVYTTTYMAMCSSTTPHSMTPATYTVTETCTGATPTWSSGNDYVPQGFTTTEYYCHQCETASTVTVTEPCGCEATNGVPAGAPGSGSPATPTGGSGDSGSGSGSPGTGASPGAGAGGASSGPSATTVTEHCEECSEETGTPSAGSGSGSGSNPDTSGSTEPCHECEEGTPTPSGGSGSSPGSDSGTGSPGAGGSGAPPAGQSGSTTTVSCPGPGCKMQMPSTSAPGGAGSTSSVTPYTGVASSSNVSALLTVFVGLAIGAVAVLL